MKRVLVVQLARFGDLVQTKRLLKSLCAEDSTEVHLCLDSSLAALAAVLYPEVHLHPVIAHGTGLGKLSPLDQATAVLLQNRAAFQTLSALNFERVYTLNFSPLSFRIASLFDPGCVIGHRWQGGQEVVGPWASLAMRWSSMRRLGLNIADFWAWHHHAPVLAESVNPPATGRGGGLGVVMAGRESRRSLPANVLAALVAALREVHGGCAVTLLGSASEDRAARSFLRELPERHARACTNLCGKTDLLSLPDILSGLDLVLTPDTGTMHLAAHLGVPVLATFLSSAWCHETGPYGLGHTILQSVRDCSPCLESQPCPTNVECLLPFSEGQLSRYLATGKDQFLPPGLQVLVPQFDAVGVTFEAKAGEDKQADQRRAFRGFLGKHLRRTDTVPPEEAAAYAQRLYTERDWICARPEQDACQYSECCEI